MQPSNLIVKTVLIGTFFGTLMLIASKFIFKARYKDEPELEKFFDACTAEEENCEKKKDIIHVSTEIVGDTLV